MAGDHEAVAVSKQLISLDALNRAVRTWWAVIGAGVFVAVGELGLTLMLTHDVLSEDFWRALIRGALTALIAASLSYAARFKKPPPSVPDTTTLPAA